MMCRLLSVCYYLPVLLVLSGCGPAWSDRFPLGTRLYETPAHRYFGQVVAFDRAHDFHNGTGAEAAVLIEQPDGEKIWGACETCADSLQIEKP